jgi:hypothetical protein
MANLLLRSPSHILGNGSPGWNSAKVSITIAGTIVYTIVKNRITSLDPVYFEISDLIRDYLDIKYDEVIVNSSQSVKATIITTIFEGLDATGTVQTTTTEDFLGLDGYGYFEDGANPTTTRGYMQSNNVIYKLADADLRIPIDVNNTSSVVYLFNNEIQYQQAISSNANTPFDYVQNLSGGVDSFKDRVLLDGGIFENSRCLEELLNEFEIFSVDEVRFSTTDGLRTVKVITLDECRFKPHKITFVNRWGGLQDLWFFRKSVESLSTTRNSFKSSVIYGAGIYDKRAHQQKSFNIESNKKITLNSGYVSEEYNAPMQELLQSEQVWMEVDTVVTPMTVTDSSLVFKTSVNDKLVDYKIELDYAFDAINNIR